MDFKEIPINFINNVSHHLMCTLCAGVFKKPSVIACGHTFCEQCIINEFQNQKRKQKTCPDCNEKVDENDHSRNIIAFKLINTCDILCPGNPWCKQGCKWKGTQQTLGRHLKLYEDDLNNIEYQELEKKYRNLESQQSQNSQKKEDLSEDEIEGNLMFKDQQEIQQFDQEENKIQDLSQEEQENQPNLANKLKNDKQNLSQKSTQAQTQKSSNQLDSLLLGQNQIHNQFQALIGSNENLQQLAFLRDIQQNDIYNDNDEENLFKSQNSAILSKDDLNKQQKEITATSNN